MYNNFWLEFIILFVAALLGAAALIPYSLRLLKSSVGKKPLRVSVPVALLLSFIQNAILFAIVIGVGLLAAHAIGLGAPYIEPVINGQGRSVSFMFLPALTLGLLGGLALLLMDLLFLPYAPSILLDTARKTSLWENFSASFYGGLNEEFLMRLFGLSAVAWLLSRIWHTPAGLPTTAIFWTANIILAVIFGLGHLPAMKGLVGRITPLVFMRSLILNMPIALICGWLFIYYGIEAAVIAHFSADIIYHVFGTIVLRYKSNP